MSIQRRDFLKATMGAASVLATGTTWAVAGKKSRVPIGFQLYSLRGEFAKDVPGTLRKVAEIGYSGVEFWGYGGTPNVYKQWTAERLRKLLDDTGLKCCGMHVAPKAIEGDTLKRTIDVNKVLGNRLINVAAAKKYMESVESIKKFAELLGEQEEKADVQGMRIGYHCHPFDMKRFGDTTGWQMLFTQVSPKVSMQLDTGNCVGGGGDPIAILKQFPNRVHSLHIKQYPGAPWTPDQPKWLEIFKLCETTQPIEWYIVEEGDAGGMGFDIPQTSLQSLRKMGK